MSIRCNARWSKLPGYKFKDQTLLKKGWGTALYNYEGNEDVTRSMLNEWYAEYSSDMSSPSVTYTEKCARYDFFTLNFLFEMFLLYMHTCT